jgi:hypothetical protein
LPVSNAELAKFSSNDGALNAVPTVARSRVPVPSRYAAPARQVQNVPKALLSSSRPPNVTSSGAAGRRSAWTYPLVVCR